jgi:hypothetical protein
MAQQGSLELLHDAVAEKILGSSAPHWTGERFVVGSPARFPGAMV